jgi:integrase/recombinase XerD
MKNNSCKLSEALFTEEDVGKLIEAAKYPCDRAFISLLFESGCRIGEVGDLRRKDIIFGFRGKNKEGIPGN